MKNINLVAIALLSLGLADIRAMNQGEVVGTMWTNFVEDEIGAHVDDSHLPGGRNSPVYQQIANILGTLRRSADPRSACVMPLRSADYLLESYALSLIRSEDGKFRGTLEVVCLPNVSSRHLDHIIAPLKEGLKKEFKVDPLLVSILPSAANTAE